MLFETAEQFIEAWYPAAAAPIIAEFSNRILDKWGYLNRALHRTDISNIGSYVYHNYRNDIGLWHTRPDAVQFVLYPKTLEGFWIMLRELEKDAGSNTDDIR